MMTAITENRVIENLTRQFRRSPLQINQLQEADAEILRLDSPATTYLTVTTDSIVEEIATGLYDDPYLIGWMTVMANMSDLAAVGANPIGILISEVFPDALSQEWISDLQRGIEEACEACGTFVLGGDTNSGKQLLLSGCAIGTSDQTKRLTRIGATPGDHLYATGILGKGNAFALDHYLNHGNGTDRSFSYQPSARLREGYSIAGIASACMDTSDGTLATLDQLMRLNHIGFELNSNIESLLHPEAKLIADTANIAPWLLLAGHHGEFELLFTVSPRNELNLVRAAEQAHWQPLYLGVVIPPEEIRLPLYDQMVRIDTGLIRNLAVKCCTDIRRYIQELCFIDNTYKKGVFDHVTS